MSTIVTPTPPKTKTALYIPALTGIRAIAAYLVFFHHFNPLNALKSTNQVAALINPLFEEGHIGVTIFFVLSGFLITLRYYENLHLTKAWFFKYMRNRIARIYPLYFIITALTFGLIALNPVYDILKLNVIFSRAEMPLVVFTNLTLLKGLFSTLKFTGISQGWTLTVEETFYLSAPLLLLGLRGNTKRIFLYPLLVIGLGLALYLGLHRLPLYGLLNDLQFIFNYTFFGRCFEFFCGIFLALQLLRRPDTGSRHATLLTYGGGLWIVACIYALDFVKGDAHVSTETVLGAVINNAILPLGVTALLLGLAKGKTLLGNFLSTKLMQLLGKSSYAFYLVHMGIINILIDQTIPSNFALNFVIINVVCILLFRFVEEPLHKRIKNA
jgi:peptidoglycan/LPS O-acetylase OafA/YrhL